jgi:hypothetical protein
MSSTVVGSPISNEAARSFLQAGASAQVGSKRNRSISRDAGRGLEMLGHAIEYLADEFSLECMSRSETAAKDRISHLGAIELLKMLNREVYFSCPLAPTFAERLRSFFRLEQAG